MKNFYNLYIKPALKILGSIKFAFFLVICLIILSIIGSIISDASVDKIKYNFIISLFFNPSTNEFKEFASTFGLLNIYTSPLFITLLSLFTINLLICTFKLFPFAKKGFPFIDENSLKNEIEFSKDISEVTDFFYKEGWNISRSPENNNLVKAEHHKPGRYGVIITHFGIIFIMIGAFVGYYMGFSGSMLVFENQTSNEVEKQNGEKVPLNFAVKLNDFNNFNSSSVYSSARAGIFFSKFSFKRCIRFTSNNVALSFVIAAFLPRRPILESITSKSAKINST